MAVDYKPTPRCRHAVFYPGQVKGALDGNQNCSVCTALPAREKPGALTPTANGDPGRPSNRWQLAAPVKPEQLQTPAPVANPANVAPTVISPRRRYGQRGKYTKTAEEVKP